MATTVFVSSSTEALPIARALHDCLLADAEVLVWEHAHFPPSAYILEGLLSALKRSRYGVFVLAPDDLLVSRGETTAAARDNVFIELGLFIGALGRDRVAVLIPSDQEIKIPSDLSGLALIKYATNRTDGNLAAAVSPAANSIRIHLSTLQEETQLMNLRDVTLPQARRFLSLSETQRRLIGFIFDNPDCLLKDISDRFINIPISELRYRLECLRLLSFIDIRFKQTDHRAKLSDLTYRLDELFESDLNSIRLDDLSSAWVSGVDSSSPRGDA